MRYLFITGWQRSGTTLITRALNAHPRVVVVYQPFFDFFLECRDIFYRDFLKQAVPERVPFRDSIAPHHDKLKRAFPKLHFSEDEIISLVDAITNRVKSDSESAPLITGRLSELTPGPASDVLLQLLAIVKECYGNDDTEIVGFKELYCEPFIDILADHFGKKFSAIQMLRDPRAVYASRNTGSHLRARGKRYPLMFILENWMHSYRAHEDYERRIPGYIPVLFENLVLQPEEELRNISHRLQIEYDPSILQVGNYLDGLNRQWSGNSSHYSSMQVFEKSTTTKWKTALNSVEIGSIEYILSQEMIAAGYLLQSSRFRVLDFIRFKERRNELVDWLRYSRYELSGRKKLECILKTIARRSK